MFSLLSRYVKIFKYPYIERLCILDPMNFSSNNPNEGKEMLFYEKYSFYKVNE